MSDISNDILKVAPAIFYPNLNCKARRIINQGGQWSGKTVNILAVLATHASRNKKEVTTVTGATLPHLKGGALRDWKDLVYPAFQRYMPAREKERWNKSDNIFTFDSGSIIEFKAFEDSGKAKGAKRHRLFVNEGNLLPWMTAYELDSRTSIQTIVDYNPNAKFWAHDNWIGKEGNQLYISDHRHNPFLSIEKHREIENNPDPELWKIYARGMTGNVTGVIFPNWRRIPDLEFYRVTKDMPYGFGVDFGDTDPTAIVKVYHVGESRYIEEIEYTPGLTAVEIKQVLIAHGYNDHTLVYCDHNRPQTVALLRRNGINRAMPAIKGPGSVNDGIKFFKEFKVFYNESSINLHKERERYIWIKDRITGESTETPIDSFNHLLDASRYFVYSHGAPLVGKKR